MAASSLAAASLPRTSPEEPADVSAEFFRRHGYSGPIRLLTPEECRAAATRFRRRAHPAPADWAKGRAVTDRFIYDIATRPELLALIADYIGPNIILWSAHVPVRAPGQVHPWHTDIESAAPEGGFVSIWIGIENTSRESALQLIAGSHLYGESIQQVVQGSGSKRGEASPENVLGWARDRLPEAELVQPDMSDGEALLFDGRLWHGSDNSRAEGRRSALLLQYASADKPVRIPDLDSLDWPFTYLDVPRPPTILVRGESLDTVNRLVPPPPAATREPLLSTVVRDIRLPLAEGGEKGFRPVPLFRGGTSALDLLGCHVSVLSPGRMPHPPHSHIEEEILIVLDGEAEVLIATSPDDPSPRIETLRPGAFIFYPAFQHHTIRSANDSPVTYLMFKWRAGAIGSADPLPLTTITGGGDDGLPAEPRPFHTTKLLHSATGGLARLHAHRTLLQPGAGYAPHTDPYDVAIVMLSGKVETLGRVVRDHGVIFYAEGEAHGMQNIGAGPASYLVFEFHAPGVIRKGRRKREKVNADKMVASAAAPHDLPASESEPVPLPARDGKARKALFAPPYRKVPSRILRRVGWRP